MSALFLLDTYNEDLIRSVSQQVKEIRTCMGESTRPKLLAQQILDRIIAATTNFSSEEPRLLISLCYCIHDVRCDNQDEARGWDTTDMEIARRILPVIRGSGLIRKSIN